MPFVPNGSVELLMQGANAATMTVDTYVPRWLQTSTLFQVVVDDQILELDP